MFKMFRISAGTPFFHGTTNSPRAIVEGLKASKATPGGTQLTNLYWFFASQLPAYAYTICEENDEFPAVLEFETTEDHIMLDLREHNSGLNFPDNMSKKALAELSSKNLNGIVFGNTCDSGDYEYGFTSVTSMRYVRYHLPHRKQRRIDRGLELLNSLNRSEYGEFEEQSDRKDSRLSMRIENQIRILQISQSGNNTIP